MPSEIGSWSWRENSVRFVGSRPRKEGADSPIVGQPTLVNAAPLGASKLPERDFWLMTALYEWPVTWELCVSNFLAQY